MTSWHRQQIFRFPCRIGNIDDEVWRFFLTGGVALTNPHPNPAPEWLQDRAWAEVVNASTLTNLKGLLEHFRDNLADWKQMYDSLVPHEHTWVTVEAVNLLTIFVLSV